MPGNCPRVHRDQCAALQRAVRNARDCCETAALSGSKPSITALPPCCANKPYRYSTAFFGVDQDFGGSFFLFLMSVLAGCVPIGTTDSAVPTGLASLARSSSPALKCRDVSGNRAPQQAPISCCSHNDSQQHLLHGAQASMRLNVPKFLSHTLVPPMERSTGLH